jgi:ribosome-associated translation inhibitor RaiA
LCWFSTSSKFPTICVHWLAAIFSWIFQTVSMCMTQINRHRTQARVTTYMQMPLQIAFENIGHSDAIEARVREEAHKLEQFYQRITSARVVIGRPQHRHHKGDTYRVRIHLTLPGAPDIVINRDPDATGAHEDAFVTVRDAFQAARRQLQDLVRNRQGQVKSHETPPHGVVASLHPEADHGFIASADGRE